MHKKEYSVAFINTNAAAEMQCAASRPAELVFRGCFKHWKLEHRFTKLEEAGDVSRVFVLVTFL